MQKKEIVDITEEMVVAYFDLEFCNDCISRHNFPVSIGVSYRQGNKEIGTYFSVIRFGEEVQLREEQLKAIGYHKKQLQETGSDMEVVTAELLQAHAAYQPEIYISFGKQDEDLLKKHTFEKILQWNFSDALNFLSNQLQLKYDISLEKYAYICEISFVHQFQPLEDARTLGQIVWRILMGNQNKKRKEEVVEEYDRKMFLIKYQDRKRAYQYLAELPALSPRQKEKLRNHKIFLRENQKRYMDYVMESCKEEQ